MTVYLCGVPQCKIVTENDDESCVNLSENLNTYGAMYLGATHLKRGFGSKGLL